MSYIKIFISHKRDSKRQAAPFTRQVSQKLEAMFEGENVFLDEDKIQTGKEWENVIVEWLRETDVFVLLLRKDMVNSEWVKREIGMAAGLQICSLIVISETMSDEERDNTARQLGISKFQYFNGGREFDQSAEQYELLRKTIELCCEVTRKDQRTWMERRLLPYGTPARHGLRDDFSIDLAPWGYPAGCAFYTAGGDITRINKPKGGVAFDVVVSSENNFLQTARIFETGLSGALRREGAYYGDDSHLLEDTVQDELDLQIRKKRLRPIRDRVVVVTHAGHLESKFIRQTGARYLFHAVSVAADAKVPDKFRSLVSNYLGMEELVHNCLNTVADVDNRNGIVFPEDKNKPEYKRDEEAAANYQPIQSIIFPIFGTGHAADPVRDNIRNILQALQSYPNSHPRTVERLALQRIYLCGFYEHYVEMIQSEAQKLLVRKS